MGTWATHTWGQRFIGSIATRNIALAVANVITLDGYVTDKANGLPLAANILFTTSQFSDTVDLQPHERLLQPVPGCPNFLPYPGGCGRTRAIREQNFLSQTFDYTTSRDFALEADPDELLSARLQQCVHLLPGFRNQQRWFHQRRLQPLLGAGVPPADPDGLARDKRFGPPT